MWLKDYRNDEFGWREYKNRWITSKQLKMLQAVKKLAVTRTDDQITDLLKDKEYQLI